MIPQRHAENQPDTNIENILHLMISSPVESDDVVLPDHAVHGVDALVHVTSSSCLAELVHEEVTEAAEVSSQLLGSDPFENLVSNGRDVIRLQDHLPQQTEKQIVVALIS